jgi:hypothetical protein
LAGRLEERLSNPEQGPITATAVPKYIRDALEFLKVLPPTNPDGQNGTA